MSTSLFSKTPTVTVLDNRGLTVCDIAYHRHPDTPTVIDARITRHYYDARSALTQSTDPRLHNAGLANFTYLTDLAGNVLRSQGVDNGITVALNDAAGRPFIAVSNISTTDDTEDRSQAVTRTWQYEDAELQGRPVSVTEQITGKAARITERFVYAGNTDTEKALNLAGACVSHYDTAGLAQTDSMALTGVPLAVTRRLLKDADNPDTVADWQGTEASAWNALLDGEDYTTLTTANATGSVLTTTDAKGNKQRVAYDVAGLLSGSWLTVKDGVEQTIVKSLTYSAAGQKLREVHGNGVVTTYAYEAETQRLTGIKTERPAGHTSGAKVLQDLRYEYDPVGNVLTVRNEAEEARYWRNQKVVPQNTYIYDSLYQLISATGREMANAGQQGSNLPSATVLFPTDSAAYTNYTRTYTYDSAGNLTQIRHLAPATNNSYTVGITVSDRSNRGVLSTLTENPSDVEALFTAGGQQKQLQPGQNLVWTPCNELLKVTPVVRDGSTDDLESYRYDGSSQRCLKVSVQKTGNTTQMQRALYLPGLELRTKKTGDTETESLQVITVGEAGRAKVRLLHWEIGKPDGIGNDQVRYSYDNLIGSCGLEVDGNGSVISMEEYYPYGGTAVWTARSEVEAAYKTVRYSGKERDATGLYYYGYRYYQPWIGRWLSADPAGPVDGLNLYRMVNNNPVSMADPNGEYSERKDRPPHENEHAISQKHKVSVQSNNVNMIPRQNISVLGDSHLAGLNKEPVSMSMLTEVGNVDAGDSITISPKINVSGEFMGDSLMSITLGDLNAGKDVIITPEINISGSHGNHMVKIDIKNIQSGRDVFIKPRINISGLGGRVDFELSTGNISLARDFTLEPISNIYGTSVSRVNVVIGDITAGNNVTISPQQHNHGLTRNTSSVADERGSAWNHTRLDEPLANKARTQPEPHNRRMTIKPSLTRSVSASW
ncbi:RHS repeat domain-containing protein [Shewanella sp. WE21]|uniref:RHS repeat domain-containing protein n=1 Tax=Shewanella sp. WE21 TaxID=2029986 RepID=UPI0020B16A6A|nr:RHS repeat domain-containing protein [Shewanella sp. WE21]